MSDKISEMASRVVYSEEDLAKRKSAADVIRENSKEGMYVETKETIIKGIVTLMRELDDMSISEDAVRKVINHFLSEIDETIFSGEGIIYIDDFGTFFANEDTGATDFFPYFMAVQPNAIIDAEQEAKNEFEVGKLIKEMNDKY